MELANGLLPARFRQQGGFPVSGKGNWIAAIAGLLASWLINSGIDAASGHAPWWPL